jgi:glycerol-3-phosphate dehydrogenase (NAD+)
LKDEIGAPPTSPVVGVAELPEPSPRALRLWRNAQAVCFDVDCTLTANDALDLLAGFMGVGAEVEDVTSAAMDGSMALEEALTRRLEAINCTPPDIQKFLLAFPPESRLVAGAAALVAALQARGVAVYLISGGFRELCLPIARALGVSPSLTCAPTRRQPRPPASMRVCFP